MQPAPALTGTLLAVLSLTCAYAAAAPAAQGPCGVHPFSLGAAPPPSERLVVASDGEHVAAVQPATLSSPIKVRVLRRDSLTGAMALDTELTDAAWPQAAPRPRLAVDRGVLAAAFPGLGTWFYRRGAAGWSLEDVLPDVQPTQDGGHFLFGDTYFAATDTGIAVAERNPGTGTWTRTATLQPSGGFGPDYGFDIDFDGRLLAVGAPLNRRVDLFARTPAGTAWWQVDSLTPNNTQLFGFGTNVEVEDLVVIVGPAATSPLLSIGVYRYMPTLGSWRLTEQILPPFPLTGPHQFSKSLQYSRGTLAISAPGLPLGSQRSGRITLFKEEPFTRLFRLEALVDGTSFGPAATGMGFGDRMFLRDGLLIASRVDGGNAYTAHLPGTTDCNLDGTADICQIRSGATYDDNHNGFPDTCELSGQRYCSPNVPNSSGEAARLGIFGPPRVLLFYMEFHVGGLPEGALAYMLASRSSQAVTNPAQWLGDLCVGGTAPISRGLGGIRAADRDGRYFFSHNRPVIPFGSGLAPILPGETWHFQCWYQDPAAVPRSNFSDAVAVTFTFL